MKIEKVHTIKLNEEELDALRAAQKVLETIAEEVDEYHTLFLATCEWDGETVRSLHELLCDIILNKDKPMQID